MTKQAYWSKEVASLLNVGESTVRKYSSLLEKSNYHFDRGNNNSRIFYDEDLILLRRLIAIVNKKDVSLEQAIELAIASTQVNEVATAATLEQTSDSVTERLERIEQTQDAILTYLKESEAQRQHEREEQRRRDAARDERLMSMIREMQEEKRLIAASKQDIPLWKRLFWWRK